MTSSSFVLNKHKNQSDFFLEPSIGPWLVFEYMALGDLAQLLRAANGNLFAKSKTPYSLSQVGK